MKKQTGIIPRNQKTEAALDVEQLPAKGELSNSDSSSTASSGFLLHPSSPLLAPTIPRSIEGRETIKEVERMLQHVAYGEQKEAEILISRKPALLLCKGNVMDLSKREFKEITAFQYALWALDWHMWTMLLKYLTEETAVAQWKGLETKGTAHGKHVSWQDLIDAYTAYLPLVDALEATRQRGATLYSAVGTHWIRQIGGGQLLLPVHVVNEYCHEKRELYPLPDFRIREELTRSRKSGEVDWYDEGCGKKWAHYRGRSDLMGCTTPHRGPWTVEYDKRAIASLLEIRQQQRKELGEVLLRSQAISDALCPHFLSSPLAKIIAAYDSSMKQRLEADALVGSKCSIS